MAKTELVSVYIIFLLIVDTIEPVQKYINNRCKC